MLHQIHRKWRRAVVLTAIALSHSAHADIVYVDMPDEIIDYYPSNGYASIDFDSNGANDLYWFVSVGDWPKCGCSLSMVHTNGPAASGAAIANGMAIAFEAGQTIGVWQYYGHFGLVMEEQWGQCCKEPAYCDGAWCETGQMHYVGARFNINGVAHYGWVRMERLGDYKWDWGIIVYDFAYESQPQTQIVAGQMCSGDTDLSGEVAVPDLLAIIEAWGICSPPCPPQYCVSDINHDCAVNVQDLLAVLNAWGACAG